MKEVSQRDETSPYNLWVMNIIKVGFLYFHFLWGDMVKTKLYTIYMGFMEARVQNGVSGGYMHAVFKPAVQLGAEIWTSPPHILVSVPAQLCESTKRTTI